MKTVEQDKYLKNLRTGKFEYVLDFFGLIKTFTTQKGCWRFMDSLGYEIDYDEASPNFGKYVKIKLSDGQMKIKNHYS